MKNYFALIGAALAASWAGTLPSQQRGTGTRFRGSRHPRLLPKGHRAKRRRLRKLQRQARKV
jgi:hypothetical protein